VGSWLPDPVLLSLAFFFMHVLITGGGGFLGSQLASALLQRSHLCGADGEQREIESIRLLDAAFRGPPEDARVQQITADVSDREAVFAALGEAGETSVFHLASMVSGGCETHYDDALRVNLDGARHLFEAVRRLPGRQRLVFASSIACYGGEGMEAVNTDRTKHTPQTTYGMTKAICELLLNDHARKGHFDARSVRLPTVIIRPGSPNAAASSWASGMFREPLAGQPCALPVRFQQQHPMTGYRTVVESFIALHEVPEERLGSDRAYVLPAHTVTPELAVAALKEVAARHSITPGPVVEAFDERIQGIVDNWPQQVDGSRALALGLPSPPPLTELIEQYLEDFVF
jgi:nucleoside-diphosphate-sugar epimerase